MKSYIQYSLCAMALVFSSQASAQSLITGVDGKQIVGKWACQARAPQSNGMLTIEGHADYSANGQAEHSDEITHRLPNGDEISMQVNSTGRWRFEQSTQRLYEVQNTVNVAYDPKHPLANTIGAQYQRSYQEGLNVEQSSFAVRLDTKEWIAVIGNSNETVVTVNCVRE